MQTALAVAWLLLCVLSPVALYAQEIDREAMMQQARQAGWQGDHARSESLYRELLEARPDDLEAWLGLAQVLSWQKKFSQSREIYQKVEGMRPDLPDGRIGLLRLLAWEGKHAEAEAGLKELLEQHPERFDILSLLGQVTAWQKKFPESIAYYQTLLKLYPGNLEALKGLARTYKWMENAEAGIALNQQILEKDPDNLQATLDTGILYSQVGDYENAIDYLEQARELAPERQDIRAMLGTLYSWTERLDDAVTELQKSLALERGDIAGYISLGRVYSWQKKTEESIRLYEEALKIDPQNTEALVGLGRTYLFDDQWDRAEQQYREALRIRPDDVDAQNALKRLEEIKAPEAVLRFDYFEFKDHDPEAGRLDSVVTDFRETAEYFHKFSAHTKLQVRYQRSDLKQVDKIFNDTDYKIDTNTVSLGLTQRLPQNFGVRARYDYSRFDNDGDNFFNLKDPENGHSGYFILTKGIGKHYGTVSYARELFISTETGDATVESIDRFSLAHDYDFTEHFSFLTVLAWSDFSTSGGLRQDYLIRPRYRLPFYEKVQLEYQLRYLSNPDEFENSFIVNFQNQILEKVRYEVDYALSFNSFDDALENLTTFFISWDISKCLSLNADARFSIETLDDQDISQSYQAYLRIKF